MKPILAILLTGFAIAESGEPQPPFQPAQPVFTNGLTDPKQVLTADIDGDGDLDALALGYDNNADGIVWFRNDGNREFSSALIVASSLDYRQMSVADLDGDGDMDVFAATRGARLNWHENTDGKGSFAEAKRMERFSLRGANSLSAADLDGDGDADPLWSLAAGRAVEWAPNLGGGSFGEVQVVAEGTNQGAADPVDFDADGDLDILVHSSLRGTIGWYENLDSSGKFSDYQSLYEVADSRVAHLAFGDLNGDGQIDIVAGAAEKLVLFTRSASRTLSAPVTLHSTQGLAEEIALGDVDNDGDLDIVFENSPNMAWLKNSGGTFGAPVSIPLTDGQLPRNAALADFDGDSFPELLTALSPSLVAWQPNNSGSFGSQKILSESADVIVSATAGDFDGDGDVDIVSAALFSNGLLLHQNDGLTKFSTEAVPVEAASPRHVVSADLNSDGVTDLGYISTSPGGLHWIAGSNNGLHEVRSISPGLSDPNSLEFFDLDGDGDLDALASNVGTKEVLWLENTDGKGNFSGGRRVGVHSAPYSGVGALDADGDGDLDIVAGTGADAVVYLFENIDGKGTFGAAQTIATEIQSPSKFLIGDIDADGRPDLLTSSLSNLSGGAYWIRSLGNRTFADPVPLMRRDRIPNGIGLGDADGDGDLDVVATVRGVLFYTFENLGGGEFGTETDHRTGGSKTSFGILEDINGDGTPDLVAISESDNIALHLRTTAPDTKPASPYELWADVHGLTGDDRAPSADGDADTLVNIQEFAFGFDPTIRDGRSILVLEGGELRYKRRIASDENELTYTLEESVDLRIWTAASLAEEVTAVSGTKEDIAFLPSFGASPKFWRVTVSFDPK